MNPRTLLLTFPLLAAAHANAGLLITGIFDGPLTGGVPKGVELYATADIADLSQYGLASANNGGGSTGQEFTFPATSVAAGEYIFVASEAEGFTDFFGFAPDFVSAAMAINGDDAIELFHSGDVIDTFGEPSVDGSGTPWEYTAGWAYRSQGEGAFSVDAWRFSGINALDNATSNESASLPMPLATFQLPGEGNPDGAPSPLPAVRLISQVQGNPDTYASNRFGEIDVSPLLGETVTIEGIVVGDYQDSDADNARNLSGFYVQEEALDEDGNGLSSEGVFVFDEAFGRDVALGDKVRIAGRVDQYFGETQIGKVTHVEVLAVDQLQSVAKAEVSLGDNPSVSLSQSGAYQADLEAYEGMLVTFPETLTIVEQFQLDRFNEIKLVAGDRPYQFTQLQSPSVEGFDAHRQTVAARSVTYDDGLNVQNAATDLLDGFAGYEEATAPRMGDQVQNLTGVLDYKWAGNSASSATWRVRAQDNGVNRFTSGATSPNPRPVQAPYVEGNLKVASLNVLNFFTTLSESGNLTAVGQRPRGANSLEEFERQLAKISQAIVGLDADVLGLVELENDFDPANDGSTAIEVLVNRVNELLGAEVYDYVYPGQRFVGSDAIAVGVIYKPAVVALTGKPSVALLTDRKAARLPAFKDRDFAADPIFDADASNRVPLAASFRHASTRDVFTVVVNHLKSKGASGLTDTASANYDQGDGAGFWNKRRLDAVTAIKEWLDQDPTQVADKDVFVVGDLNAYAAEAPVQYLSANGFNNVEPPTAYSYVFDGQIGTLDYILVSDSLLEKLNEAVVWHTNADEADVLDYNLDFGRARDYFDPTTATRNSDHDPVLAGFYLASESTSIRNAWLHFVEEITHGRLQGTASNSSGANMQTALMSMLLQQATVLSEQGMGESACRTLSACLQLADGERSTPDAVTGAGLSGFARLLNKAFYDLGCTT